MPEFAYRAIAQDGSKASGTLTADSLLAAQEAVAERGLIPVQVKVAPKTGNGINLNMQILGGVKAQELILFTKQLRTMFHAGVPVMKTLEVMEQQSENPLLKRTVSRISEDIRAGSSLYEAFGRHPRVFPGLYVGMVRAGEASGRLPEVLDKLVVLLAHEHKVRTDINSAMQYPITVIIALIGAFVMLLTFVVPKFVGIFQRTGIGLPLPTKICIAMYSFLEHSWPLLLLGLALGGLGLNLWLRTHRGRLARDWTLLRVPIIGPVLIKAALSRFATIFAILQASGVAILDSLDMLAGTIGNTAIAQEFTRIRQELIEGRGISGPLSRGEYFTPLVVNMVAIGEEAGNLEEMLREVAEHYDDEVSYAVSRMSQAIGPLLMVTLAGVVGFFALAIFLPMWDMTKMVH